jgi:hypothetical protein
MLALRQQSKRPFQMDRYPPAYVSQAMKQLPDSVLQTVEIDALRVGPAPEHFFTVQNPGAGCGAGSGRCTWASASIGQEDASRCKGLEQQELRILVAPVVAGAGPS